MNRARKEHIKERLDRLDAEEHAQIFEIIKRYTDTYTRTQTGVLVSSDVLCDECLREVETLVSYYLDQRGRMETSRM